MKRIAILSAAALIGVGSLAATDAEARYRRHHGGAVAAGVLGGLAASALIGAAASNAYAAPAYGYGYGHGYAYGGYAPEVSYGYAAPTYDDGYAPVDYGYAPAPVYHTTRVVRRAYAPVAYDYAPRRVYRAPRVVRGYDYAPARRSGVVRYGYRSGDPNARNPSRRAWQQNRGQTSGGYLR